MVKIYQLEKECVHQEILNIIEGYTKKGIKCKYYFSPKVHKKLHDECTEKNYLVKIYMRFKMEAPNESAYMVFGETINRRISSDGYRCFRLNRYSLDGKIRYMLSAQLHYSVEHDSVLFVEKDEDLSGIDLYVKMENGIK